MLGQVTGNLDSLDSPWPRFGGSHHLPPCSIVCSSPSKLHPNGTFSRESQSGILKLSQFALPGIWASIISCSNLQLGWGLRQSCSSLRELSNAMLHTIFICRDQVNSGLLVVGSQITSLTPGPSFAHNLGYRCPNGLCEAILDIYTSRPFEWHQVRCFDPCNWTLSFRES